MGKRAGAMNSLDEFIEQMKHDNLLDKDYKLPKEKK